MNIKTPAWLDAFLPYVYIVAGVLACAGASYIGVWDWQNVSWIAFGGVCILAGADKLLRYAIANE